ncbi:tetratricopeptide repeat protein [Stagnimonas aquatica]|uniref:Tetratricopeptide repeat protein n=1 Tax=Stagnimonas aquatica TaxID=2689987 RepID=A0A3N0V251_9GAMM|nr:tetratricopeptide repeat protein [Stagnimonas aquatica]ROH86793.1 tetratricopeptide repeat protein [Stagnimonas aquatica]
MAIYGCYADLLLSFADYPGDEYAVFLIEQKRLSEALAIYRAMYPEALKVFGDGNGNVVAWGGNYGRALLESGDYRGAQQMLEGVLPGLVATFGERNPRVRKARERLAQAEAALAP